MANVSTTAPLQQKIHQYIAEHRDCVGQEIATALNVAPKQAGYCLMKLRQGKFVVGKGVTRAMKYRVTAKKLPVAVAAKKPTAKKPAA